MYCKSFDLPDRGLFFGLDFWGLLFTDSLSLCRETAGSSFSRVGEGKSAPSTASGGQQGQSNQCTWERPKWHRQSLARDKNVGSKPQWNYTLF